MINQILLYLGSALPLFWGTAHLFVTKSVVGGFGDISLDNKRIITMEWIVEGVSLIFIVVLTATVTYVDHTSVISRVVYWLTFGVLNALYDYHYPLPGRGNAHAAQPVGPAYVQDTPDADPVSGRRAEFKPLVSHIDTLKIVPTKHSDA